MHKNTNRDERVLDHIGLYRISFRRVLSMLYFHGRTPGNVIHRLLAEGRIQARTGLPDHLRYYQLTPSEAAARGLPIARSRPPKPQALHTNLGILWNCCMTPGIHDRRRLEQVEMVKLFGERFPRGPHLMQAGPKPYVLRVRVLAPTTRTRTAVRLLRARIDRLRKHPTLGAWVRNNQYAFLLLVESDHQRTRLVEVIERHALKNRAHIIVAYAPSHASAGPALRAAERRPRAP